MPVAGADKLNDFLLAVDQENSRRLRHKGGEGVRLIRSKLFRSPQNPFCRKKRRDLGEELLADHLAMLRAVRFFATIQVELYRTWFARAN
jgi:hypothetical protein